MLGKGKLETPGNFCLGKTGLFSATASFRDGNAYILNMLYSPLWW